MKIKNIVLAAVACMMAFGAVSCSDKLDIKQHGVLNYDTYYNTDEQIESATAAIYLETRGWNYNYYIPLMKEMFTDDFVAGGSMRGDNIDLQKLNEFSFDSEQDYIEGMFSAIYSLVYKCNVVLAHVDESGTAVALRSRAEAKVLRAWGYFDLTTLWGNPPIVDHELLPSEYSMPNATTEELWAFIEKDLTEAIESGYLPEKKDVNDTETWRVTKQFAQAILGKAYLWQKKYADAATMFQNVIDSQKYDLYKGNYGDLHRTWNKHYCESIFESNWVADDANPYAYNFTMYKLMIHWRVDKMNNISSTPFMQTGWGFRQPKKDLYDAFVKDEGKDGYRLNQTMLTYDQLKDQYGVSVKEQIINEGYFMYKDVPFSDDRGVASDYYYNCDNLWMRYAEVLLCASEAYFMKGDKDKAAEYLNLIRERAGLTDITAANIKLDDIKLEKRLELCGEGTRFQDLLRWGDAATAMADNGKEYPVLNPNGTVEYKSCNNTTYGFKTGKHDMLPYPATECRLNKNIVQNPGW